MPDLPSRSAVRSAAAADILADLIVEAEAVAEVPLWQPEKGREDLGADATAPRQELRAFLHLNRRVEAQLAASIEDVGQRASFMSGGRPEAEIDRTEHYSLHFVDVDAPLLVFLNVNVLCWSHPRFGFFLVREAPGDMVTSCCLLLW